MERPPNKPPLHGEQEYIIINYYSTFKGSVFEFQGVIFTFLANRTRLYNLPQLPHTNVYAYETKIVL